MKEKKVLIIDCQLLQTTALHRGMGKYTLAVIDELKNLVLPYEKIIILLSDQVNQVDDDEFISATLQNLETIRLPLKKTKPTRPGEYQEVLEHNRSVIDKYVANHLSGYSTDFLITSIFHEDGCSAFPTHAKNKYLLVYDLIPLQFPEYYLVDTRGRHQYLSRFKELFKATHYFTISETVANDLSLQLGISLDKITPINGSYISRSKIKSTKPLGFTGSEKFILMPTGDDARKNNLRAVIAFEEFNSKSGYAYKLVLTSFFGDKSKSELNMQSNHLLFTGNIKEEELAWLYANAQLILFPSEYEGLGMPPLEAVEFDKPVLCSAIDVFKEISETAFYFCDPYDVDDISSKLQELLINNKPTINKKEYKRILQNYTWTRTAKRMSETFVSNLNTNTKVGRKRLRVAVFGPDPSGYSAIGKVIQEQHYEMSQYADVDYFLEKGLTDKAKSSKVRINYLPYVANCLNPWSLTRKEAGQYDRIIYHLGNSEYHVATIVKALAFPSTVILHDTRIAGALGIVRDLGYITNTRYEYEKSFQKAIREYKGIEKNGFNSDSIGSVVNVSKRVITHSNYAADAAKQVLVREEDANKITTVNLPTPAPYTAYKAIPGDRFIVGYAGIIHAAKGLDLIKDIAKGKYKKPVTIKIFGFSLLTDEAKAELSKISNLDMIISPSDTRFIHELETCNVVVGFRPDYHGETSLSTLETLRLGKPVIVNDVGWFSELPDKIVRKVKHPGSIPAVISETISNEEKKDAVDSRVQYIKSKHGMHTYIAALLGDG